MKHQIASEDSQILKYITLRPLLQDGSLWQHSVPCPQSWGASHTHVTINVAHFGQSFQSHNIQSASNIWMFLPKRNYRAHILKLQPAGHLQHVSWAWMAHGRLEEPPNFSRVNTRCLLKFWLLQLKKQQWPSLGQQNTWEPLALEIILWLLVQFLLSSCHVFTQALNGQLCGNIVLQSVMTAGRTDFLWDRLTLTINKIWKALWDWLWLKVLHKKPQ